MSDRGSGSWPTPTKSDYGSSQNGVNASRPSSGTPSISTRVRSWPTPIRSDETGGPTRQDAESHRRGRKLSNEIRGWPTPLKIDAKDTAHSDTAERRQTMTDHVRARGWPTPVKGDWKDSARHTTTTGVMHPGTMLTDAVRLHGASLPTGPQDPIPPIQDGSSGSSGMLVANPRFIEALQGAPAGWTDGPVKLESLAWEIRSLSQRRTGPFADSSSHEGSLACGPDDEDDDLIDEGTT